jgi:putative addiction module component (TIGR02574 family)
MNSTLRALPIEPRLQLVEDLWDSIAADQRALALTMGC